MKSLACFKIRTFGRAFFSMLLDSTELSPPLWGFRFFNALKQAYTSPSPNKRDILNLQLRMIPSGSFFNQLSIKRRQQ